MRRLLPVLVLVAVPTLPHAQEERPVPSDSSRVRIAGCAHDRAFIVDVPQGRERSSNGIAPGRRFRLSGPRSVLGNIRRREGSMVEITGLVRKSDLAGPGGVRLFGGRVRIGGAPPRDRNDPMYNQVVIDVESFQLLPDSCPAR
ncbi:MAG: hypothetical protein FJW14_00440 [Acidimicrobiia bacterium]|nr:hypothetical protein [Acidimicrobiia bacterium]